MILYSDTEGRGGHVDTSKMDGTAAYLRHYGNLLYLQFIANNPAADPSEKRQAVKEMAICERKLAYWRRHHNFVQEAAARGCEELKRQWGTSIPSAA